MNEKFTMSKGKIATLATAVFVLCACLASCPALKQQPARVVPPITSASPLVWPLPNPMTSPSDVPVPEIEEPEEGEENFLPTVTSGAFCSHEGARGKTNAGVPMRCTKKIGESRARWRRD